MTALQRELERALGDLRQERADCATLVDALDRRDEDFSVLERRNAELEEEARAGSGCCVFSAQAPAPRLAGSAKADQPRSIFNLYSYNKKCPLTTL